VYTIDGVERKLPDFLKLSEEQKRQIKILTGHVGFGLHSYFPQSTTYFTFLRNPVDLVTSYYYYVRYSVEHPYHQLIVSQKMSLKDFLESQIDEHMHNTQTRMLAGKANSGTYYECTEDDLEVAKNNLSQYFSVVGLTEKFDETLLLLQNVFGWQNLHYARMNVTRKRPSTEELGENTGEMIVQANQLDIELYQYAQAVFYEQIEKQGSQFFKQVKSFKNKNQRWYPFVYALWHTRRQSTLSYRRNIQRLRNIKSKIWLNK
jgi:hypothetical protein